MAISRNFLRLGLIARKWALRARLDTPENQRNFQTIISKYQSNAKAQMYFRPGRAKLEDVFPVTTFEIMTDNRPYAATSYTKDAQIDFSIKVNVKAAGGPRTDESDQGVLIVEDYAIELCELVREILNEPTTQQITITQDQNGKQLDPPIHIYESRGDSINYGYGYNGAIRFGEIRWFCKFYLLGPLNPSPGQIPP